MFLVEKRLFLSLLLLLVSVSLPCNKKALPPLIVSSEVNNKRIKLKKKKVKTNDNDSWTSTFFDANRWSWLKAIWENHHIESLTYLVLWPFSYLTVKNAVPIILEMIAKNWPLIFLIIAVIIYLRFLHDIMITCITVISKPTCRIFLAILMVCMILPDEVPKTNKRKARSKDSSPNKKGSSKSSKKTENPEKRAKTEKRRVNSEEKDDDKQKKSKSWQDQFDYQNSVLQESETTIQGSGNINIK